MCLAQQHTGNTTQDQVNICTFVFQGRADSHIVVESASITCTGRQRVPLTIASMLNAFSANFTGVYHLSNTLHLASHPLLDIVPVTLLCLAALTLDIRDISVMQMCLDK